MTVEVAAQFFRPRGFKFFRRFWPAMGKPVCARAQLLLLPKNAFTRSAKINDVCHILSPNVAAPVEPILFASLRVAPTGGRRLFRERRT